MTALYRNTLLFLILSEFVVVCEDVAEYKRALSESICQKIYICVGIFRLKRIAL